MTRAAAGTLLLLAAALSAAGASRTPRAARPQTATMQYSMIPVGVRVGEENNANFNSAVFSHGDAVYVAFVRADPAGPGRYQTVVGRHAGGQWQFSVVEPNTARDPWHAQPSLAVDRDGYVHVTYNMHSSFWQYSVSRRPDDISEWEFRGQELQGPHDKAESSFHPGPGTADIPGNRITYPFMTTDCDGVPYVIYREALKTQPGVDYFEKQWSLGIARYDLSTKKWQRVGPGGGVFPFATEPGYRGQGGHIYFDLRNRMHVSWIFYAEYQSDGSGHLKPNYPCYAYSDDGASFHKADGSPLSLPADLAHSDIVLDPRWLEPAPNGYFSGYTEVCAMPDGTPYVQVLPKDPPPGKGRAIVGYDRAAGRWSEPIRTPYAATRFVIDSAGTITAISSGLRVHRSYDAGRTWKTWDVDTADGPFDHWPDYVYARQTNQVRLLAQSRLTGELRVYTISFSDAPPAR